VLSCSAGCQPPANVSPTSYVEWRSIQDPVDRPIAVFVVDGDVGIDRIARDWDVTTFLNDRFHPLRVAAFGAQPAGTAAFYSADGCLLYGPFVPATGSAWIRAANEVILLPAASGRSAPDAVARACTP
jgi:hypothetical protein